MLGPEDEARDIVKYFRQGFEKIKNKPKLLYGLGINTKILLHNMTDQHIVGVMDAKHEGETFEGMHIYAESEARAAAEIIVIVARAAIIPLIYNRIKYLEDSGMQIFDVRGNNLHQSSLKHFNLPEEVNEEAIRREILQHDIICFDIFDTLIARKVVQPSDIFQIVELRLKKRGIKIPFAKMRQNAERYARQHKISPTLRDIYKEMSGMMNLEAQILDEIMQEEVQTEIDYADARTKIVEFFEYARKNGKKIYLVSEMYLETSQIKAILNKCNIVGYDDIFVSCEYGKNKWPDGALYEEVRRISSANASILHLGDNEGADIECALKKKFDAIRIYSNYEIMVHSAFSVLLSHNRTIGDSVAIGTFAARYLSDPFLLSAGKGILKLDRAEDVGYICYAPLIVGFLSWIKKQCENRKLPYVCFVAREGWILHKVWKVMEKMFPLENMPDGGYILGSRRALAVSAICNEQDIKDALQKVPAGMKNANMMKSRFGLENIVTDEKESNENCACRYRAEILENAKKERESYNRYIDRKMKREMQAIIVDAVSAGTIAKYFFRVTGKKGCMLCIAKSKIPGYSVYDEIEAYAFLGEDSKYAPKYKVHKYIGELESVLTAPYPMFLSFDQEGKERYAAPELSQKNKEILLQVHNGILNYAEEIYRLIPDLEYAEFTPELCDGFFGLAYETGACAAEEVMGALGVTNSF